MSSTHQWPGTTHPGPPPTAPPAAGPGVPVPPATVVVAVSLAVVGIVCLVVANAVADLGDLFAPLEWRTADERIVVTALSTVAGAGLLAGSVAALFRRGGGLLRASGVALAALALTVLVLELAQDADVTRTVASAVVAVLGIVIGLLAGVQPSRRWYESGERAAAEQAIARALANGGNARVGSIAGRGVGWAVAAAVFGVAVVGAAALVVGQLAPPVVGEGQDQPWFGAAVAADEAEEIPVDSSDYDWDPGLDRLAEACADGSFSACDDLYLESDVGSDYEFYGSTCGGRTSQQRGDCTAEFD